MINRQRLIAHSALRRDQHPRESPGYRRWKMILYALCYSAEWLALRAMLARNRVSERDKAEWKAITSMHLSLDDLLPKRNVAPFDGLG